MSTLLQKLADHPFTEVAGWTLLHFLWQGLLIAAITAVLLAGLRSATASTRYIVACCGIVLMALAPLVTSVWITNGIDASPRSLIASGESPIQTLQIIPDGLTKNSSTAPLVENLTQIAPVHSSTPLPETTAIPVPAQSEVTWRETLSASFPYFVVLWCVGVLALSLRLLGGLWRVRQWRRSGVAIESSELIELMSRLGKKLGLKRRFDLLESASAAVPAVIGWIKPAVIVPTSLLSGLTTAELESLLAHELAHIRRHDYLVNLLQTVIETLLFYHPAVWWLSGVVRCERENCCDDLAVEACGNKLDFVRALARMEELRCGEPGLALSARGGSLLGRVERLVAPERLTSSRWPAGIAALISVTVVAIGIGMATMADETPSKSDSPTSVSSASESENDDDFARHQPEVKVVDAVTRQTHEVLSDVRLSQGDTSTRLDMKYSNLMQYTFVPARIAKELGAKDLGEIDFGDTPPQKAEHVQQTIRSAFLNELVPQPPKAQPATDKASPPPAQKNAANEPVYVDDLDGPAGERKIVPYDADSIWVPDHLAFYGVNQKKQTKFRVVRIEQVNLGLGPRFGPVNALVLDDANTSLGVLGSNWARIPRGPKGETFVHSAVDGFWFMELPRETKAQESETQASIVFQLKHALAEGVEKTVCEKLVNSAETNPDSGNNQDFALPPFKIAVDSRTNSLIVNGTKTQIELIKSLIDVADVVSENPAEISAVNEKILATHTYDLSRRESSGWIEFDGASQPVDDGPEAEGVKVYLTLMMDIVAVDQKTGKVLWHHTYGKQNPSWKTASIVDRGSELPQAERLVAEFVSSDGMTRRRYELRKCRRKGASSPSRWRTRDGC
jgi:beta-lactamase regulating signal transducer with metallopeptidase domain